MEAGLTGAILCGGYSLRMGRDKAELEIEGSKLLDRAIARLRGVAAPLLLAGGSRRLERPGCVSVLDPRPDLGPLAGLVAALRHSPHPLCAVVAVDMPDLSPALLVQLARRWRGEDAVVPLGPRGPEPLHAVYCRSGLAAAERALDGPDLSLRGLLGRLRVLAVPAAELEPTGAAPGFGTNLNTPNDLHRWRAARAPSPAGDGAPR